MKVVWFVNGMMPEFSTALGREVGNTGGWMPSLIDAIRQFAPHIELHIVCEADGDYVREMNGTYYYAFKNFNHGLRWGRSSKRGFAEKVRSLILKTKPDLIHFHGTENGYADLDDIVWCGVPRVVTLQGILNGIYPHYMGGLTSQQLKSYQNRLRNLITGKNLFDTADLWRTKSAIAEALSLGKMNHIAGRTDWDHAWAVVLAPRATYHYVGEILRPEFYARDDRSCVISHRIYASAAFKYPLKGGHVMLQALAYLKDAYPDVKLAVADGLEKLRPTSLRAKLSQTEYNRYLAACIQKLGLEDNVELLPSIDSVHVRAELEKAEVYCQVSFVENSPNSLAEAQLVGVPVVASFAGGIPSMVEDCRTGLLVQPGDAATLATAIARLFDDNGLKTSLVENAWKAAIKRHDPQIVVGDLLNCYRKVMADA